MTPAVLFFAGIATWLLGWGVALAMARLARLREGRHAWTLLDDDTIDHQTEETP